MLSKSVTAAVLLPLSALAAETGSTGKLSSLDGGLGGTVKVINSTALSISGYTLKDASAPALYWWGSTTDDLPKGFRINNERVSKPASTDVITIILDAGKTAADFSVVGLWCEKLSANFGQATLAKDGDAGSSNNTDTSDKGSDEKSAAAGIGAYYQAAMAALVSATTFAAYLA